MLRVPIFIVCEHESMNKVILNYGLLFAMPMDQANLYYCQTQIMIAHCGEQFKQMPMENIDEKKQQR